MLAEEPHQWSEYPIDQIKPLAVEQWLKGLDLAPKGKGHLKNQMTILFNCAMRWELLPYQANPMGLVRVKDSSKRVRVPVVLTIEQFQRVLLYIPEPYRTMCVVAGCLELRISDVLELQWCDFDWRSIKCRSGGPGFMLTLANPRPKLQEAKASRFHIGKSLAGTQAKDSSRASREQLGFPQASALGCPRILGAHNVAGCLEQAKWSEWEDLDGTHFVTPIRRCSTSTGQT